MILDIDGTMVDAHGTCHPRLGDVLLAAHAAGVPLACATTRARASARFKVGLLAWLVDHGVFDNGTVVVVDGEPVARRELAPAMLTLAVERLSAACRRINFAIMHASWPPAFLSRPTDGELHEWGAADRQRVFAEALKEAAVKLNAWIPGGGSGSVAPMAAALADVAGTAFDLIVFDRGAIFSVIPVGVCKASGARTWLDRIGCHPQAMLAAGDDVTDAPLLRLAGFPIAIAGGHPDAQAAAGLIVRGSPTADLADAIDTVQRGLMTHFESPPAWDDVAMKTARASHPGPADQRETFPAEY